MDAAVLTALVAAALGGGFLTEVFRSFRDRKRMELDLFYPTWKEEMERIHKELSELRVQVTLLSDEVRRLGGDPIAVRYPNKRNIEKDEEYTD